MSEKLLEVKNLNVTFRIGGRTIRPVRDVTLSVDRDQTVGIVGESGSGKSVFVRTVMGLIGGGKTTERTGTILFNGADITKMSKKELRRLWGSRIGMVLQDPMRSLNPVRKIGIQLAETIRAHQRGISRERALRKAEELLTSVGIADAKARMGMYPFQLSGGMRQRVMIAIALAGEVELLIADEPTTALDVSIQNQILNLIAWHRENRAMTMLLVTHDLAVAAGRTDRIVVMYGGEIVESAPTRELFRNVKMPYTRALLEASPRLSTPSGTPIHGIAGQPPNLAEEITGCAFAPRCAFAQARCRSEHPPLETTADGHQYRCWFPLQEPVSADASRAQVVGSMGGES